MSSPLMKIPWEAQPLAKFNLMIAKLPLFHREIAKTVVCKEAELNARERGAQTVEESDIIRAFFSEVPMAFYSLMIRLLDEVGFEYKKYQPQAKDSGDVD